MLGRILCALGRYDEAEPLAHQGRELGGRDDLVTQEVWRRVEALVYSARGQHEPAEELARQAADFAFRSDSPLHHGEALNDLAEVLNRAGRRDEATAAWREALAHFERKQIIPLARRTRARLVAFVSA